MVRIFRDGANGSGRFAIQTSCLDVDAFLADLAEALAIAIKDAKEGEDVAILGVLTQAMPIAFKLSGYKADEVQEQRVLLCGSISPSQSQLLASAGR